MQRVNHVQESALICRRDALRHDDVPLYQAQNSLLEGLFASHQVLHWGKLQIGQLFAALVYAWMIFDLVEVAGKS